MKVKAPIVTLLAGLVIAGVLLVLNIDLSNDIAKNNAATDQTPAPATSAAAPSAETSTPQEPPPTSPTPAAGGGDAAQQGTVTYAGAVEGGKASIGIVINNGKAIAYVCDGKSVEAWMEGTAANGQISLAGAKGSLTGTYGNGQVSGNVVAGGKSWGFAVKSVTAPSGLYRSNAALRDKLDASWVVRPDGVQVGVLKKKDGTFDTAPNFDTRTNTVTVDGSQVKVEPGVPGVTTGY